MTVAEGIGVEASHARRHIASMGPQLDSCGRRTDGRTDERRAPLLQWGRNLTVAEGDQADALRVAGTDASMGPQLDSCGRP